MKKKLFISLLTISMLFSIIAVPFGIAGHTIMSPSEYDDTFLGELKYKYDRLNEIKGKKIVFIGGSSLPFGLRSSYIEDYFKDGDKKEYEVVDFGVYAALGTKVMLDLARESIRKGDIVIISPEQQEQTLSMYFNGNMMWQALDGRISIFNKLNKEDKVQMIGDFAKFSQEKMEMSKLEKLEISDIYKRESFDEYGDIKSDICSYNIMSKYYDENMLIYLNEEVISDDFINYMNEFNKDVLKKGGTTFYRFSPMNRLAIKGNIDEYYNYLNDKLEFKILGNPHNAILDPGYFYDTNFHLNNVGALLNTYNIIKEIKIELGDNKPFSMTIPHKPYIKGEEEKKEGDNSMLSIFDIKKMEVDATIIELLDKEIEKIIIPYSIDGLPIVTFRKNVFFRKKSIKSITIQDNIKSIPTGAFYGCSSLEEIIIQNEKPSSISPGEGLIGSNSNAYIYVPKKSVTAYKTNYFWSQYANRIKPISEGSVCIHEKE